MSEWILTEDLLDEIERCSDAPLAAAALLELDLENPVAIAQKLLPDAQAEKDDESVTNVLANLPRIALIRRVVHRWFFAADIRDWSTLASLLERYFVSEAVRAECVTTDEEIAQAIRPLLGACITWHLGQRASESPVARHAQLAAQLAQDADGVVSRAMQRLKIAIPGARRKRDEEDGYASSTPPSRHGDDYGRSSMPPPPPSLIERLRRRFRM